MLLINDISISELELGKAGEHLVCADLILKGYLAYLSDQGLSYDVVLDLPGKLVRIQVKTTSKPMISKIKTPTYCFDVKRAGKRGRKQLTSNDVDLFALVALDTVQIGYIIASSVGGANITCRIDTYRGEYKDEIAEERKERITALRNKGYTYNEIGNKLNSDASSVHHTVNRAGKKYQRRYLSALTIKSALEELYNSAAVQ